MGSTLSTPKHICLVTAPAPPPGHFNIGLQGDVNTLVINTREGGEGWKEQQIIFSGRSVQTNYIWE